MVERGFEDWLIPQGYCWQCGQGMNRASGHPEPPRPGDFTLCFSCLSLNVFTPFLSFRKPMLAEYELALKDRTVQRMRRAMIEAKEAVARGES